MNRAHVDLEWTNTEAVEKLEQFLPHLCAQIDADGLLNQSFDTREWIEQARGKSSALAWLLDRIALIPTTPALREQSFESLGFDIHWTHHDIGRLRTGARFPARPIHYQRGEFARGVNVKELLNRPLSGNKPLPMKHAAKLLDACRSALAARRRETDPVTYANDREITLFQLDHGIDVAIIGMKPDRRLPIESFFGYVAARNRIPCSYGGGWVLGRRCEIGVNIFDEFRGGESALLFAQIMRVYHRHFGVTHFLVDPFQFGAGNAEAIKSGAFWFYYRLGFRPIDAALHHLAENEATKIQADRTHRSSAATLRRLAGDKVRFDLNTAPAVAGDLDLADLGIAVTHWIGRRFDGDLAKAGKWSERHIRGVLGIRSMSARSEFERNAFRQWSILMSMIDDIKTWSGEKQLAAKIMRAKIGPSERTFALALQRHPRLLGALAKIAVGGSKLNSTPDSNLPSVCNQ
ncbi:MAG: hypothetical protein IPK83_00620 [Planctomycetes bacterium]|nr:hypothetical protein [Planctomycetota bacterium]